MDPTAPNIQHDQVKKVKVDRDAAVSEKSQSLAVILSATILGILGLHHFYLNRSFFGIVYVFSLGVFGVGWVFDWFRIKSLVRKCNKEELDAKDLGYKLKSPLYFGYLTKISFYDAFLLWLPPIGLLGIYQYYLGRRSFGKYHTLTLGRCVIGWLLDFFRLRSMVSKANNDIKNLTEGKHVEERPYSVFDAYTLVIPFGFLGLHHFYLGNTKRGILYFFTGGVFVLGWIADLFQMKQIVEEANENRKRHGPDDNRMVGDIQGQVVGQEVSK